MNDLLLVHRHLAGLGGSGCADNEVKAAWERLRPALMPPHGLATPPTPHSVAWNGAARLADQLYRMGLDERVTAPDSVGLERLLLRWVQAAEAMTQLLTVIWEQADARRAAAAWKPGRGGGEMPPVWDGYQMSYCDECGAELTPDGICMTCARWGG